MAATKARRQDWVEPGEHRHLSLTYRHGATADQTGWSLANTNTCL